MREIPINDKVSMTVFNESDDLPRLDDAVAQAQKNLDFAADAIYVVPHGAGQRIFLNGNPAIADSGVAVFYSTNLVAFKVRAQNIVGSALRVYTKLIDWHHLTSDGIVQRQVQGYRALLKLSRTEARMRTFFRLKGALNAHPFSVVQVHNESDFPLGYLVNQLAKIYASVALPGFGDKYALAKNTVERQLAVDPVLASKPSNVTQTVYVTYGPRTNIEKMAQVTHPGQGLHRFAG